MENIHTANTKPNKNGVAVLISDEVDLVVMNTTRDTKGNFRFRKWSFIKNINSYMCLHILTKILDT